MQPPTLWVAAERQGVTRPKFSGAGEKRNESTTNQRALSWTRIDMLLALYNAAINHIQQAQAAMDDNDERAARRSRMKALRIVVALRAGLNPEYGELVEKLESLCHFVETCLEAGSREDLASSIRVLNTLREGYEGVREEAVKLESDGTIPPLQMDSAVQRMA